MWRDDGFLLDMYIIGLRHRLVHDYRNINLTKVWESVQSGVPQLIEQLEWLVPPE